MKRIHVTGKGIREDGTPDKERGMHFFIDKFK
jgi:hypothetical protein